MKELAGEINMYQAKVPFLLSRPTSSSTTSSARRRKSRRFAGSTTSRRRGNRSHTKTRRYCSRPDLPHPTPLYHSIITQLADRSLPSLQIQSVRLARTTAKPARIKTASLLLLYSSFVLFIFVVVPYILFELEDYYNFYWSV